MWTLHYKLNRQNNYKNNNQELIKHSCPSTLSLRIIPKNIDLKLQTVPFNVKAPRESLLFLKSMIGCPNPEASES